MIWTNIKKPILALAPMADFTDAPFCRVCREVSERPHPNPLLRGEGNLLRPFVIFREMVSAEAIVRGSEKTLKMCEFEEIERPVVLQLFGSDPDTIVSAAQILVGKGSLRSSSQPIRRVGLGRDDSVCEGLDVNMGCPVPKIAQKGRAGAYLMKEPEQAVAIVKALKSANLGLPISVKTRLGWASEDEILRFAPLLEEAGVDVLTIHGRTKKQGYSGQANWEMIGRVKKLLSIPVIANGDIKNSEDIKKCLEITGADGVMIGRGALGNPWIFSNQIPPPEPALSKVEGRGRLGGGYSLDETSPPTPLLQGEGGINFDEIKRVVLRHAELHLAHYGEEFGLKTFRKHLLYYFKGFEGVKELRYKLVKVKTISDLREILKNLKI